MSTLSIFVVLVLLCVGSSAAQLVRSTPHQSETVMAQQRVEDFVVSPTRDHVTWTAFGRAWSVRLELSDVVVDNMDYFHGVLDGDDETTTTTTAVSFALLPGRGLSGMIATPTDTYWISARPIAERSFSESEADLGIFMTRESGAPDVDAARLPPISEPRHVETEVADVATDEVSVDSDVSKRATTKMTTYKVAVFFDQDWASSSNNPWASQADTVGLFNDVNAIYKTAGLSQFKVVYQNQVKNSYSTVNEMLTYWSDVMSTKKSAFKDTSYTNQLWLVGKNVGGLAYVGTTCKGTSQNMNRKTAVVGLVNYSRLWTVKSIAHELGHNRGAQHQFDNQCSGSTKAGCQCSVMSYCFPAASNNPQGATNWFSTETIAQMKAVGCY